MTSPPAAGAEPVVVVLGGKRCLLKGKSEGNGEDFEALLHLCPSPEPLLTKEAVNSYEGAAAAVLRFTDRASIESLIDLLECMKRGPNISSWVVVRGNVSG